MANQETAYGYPLVTAENVYDVLAELGVVPWKKLEGPIDLESHLKSLEDRLELLKTQSPTKEIEDERKKIEAGLKEASRFAPKNQLVVFANPNDGRLYNAFRTTGRSWQTTFTLLPNPKNPKDDLLLVVGEWKQGTEDVSLVSPSGVPDENDQASGNPFAACAMRIFQHETGMELEKVIALSDHLVGVTTRQNTQGYHPFLGIPKLPIERGEAKLDSREFLKAVVIPLSEWLKLIKEGRVYEECATGVTIRALLCLGRIQLI